MWLYLKCDIDFSGWSVKYITAVNLVSGVTRYIKPNRHGASAPAPPAPSISTPRHNMSSSFPPVRVCIFDVDGLLINSEDIYTEAYNNILREYGKPDYPWSIKAKQQSRGHQVSPWGLVFWKRANW